MPRDCPQNRCDFFLQDGAASCPACGRSVRPTVIGMAIGSRRGLVATTALVAGFLMVLWPVRGTSIAWLAVAIAITVIASFGGVAQWQLRTTPPRHTLDSRYRQAREESERWLQKWGELFTLGADAEDFVDDEHLLLVEARAAAADAAAEASFRRDDYANRYVANSFERLDFIALSKPLDASDDWTAAWHHAVGTVERYLDTLWLDQYSADRAQKKLQALDREHGQSTHRSTELIQLASSVRLFDVDTNPDLAHEPAATMRNAGDLIEANLHRLHVERSLLRDAPLAVTDIGVVTSTDS